MSLMVNLVHLKDKHLHIQGDVSTDDLDLEGADELVHLQQPVKYDLEVQKSEDNLLVHGNLSIVLQCECARCLKPYDHLLNLESWTCHIPLSGEDSAPVANDCVDLTPYIREDIVLAFPQHPLCGMECQGPDDLRSKGDPDKGGAGDPDSSDSRWSELDNLKF